MHRGWGGKERAGRWNPLVVRVGGSAPQNATLQVISATPGRSASVFDETIAVGPSAGSYELFTPNHYGNVQRSVLVLRDAEGRTLGQHPPHIRETTTQPAEAGPVGTFIGISGQPQSLENLLRRRLAGFGYLPPRFLPRDAIGYDGIDILYLNRPDFREIGPDQQQAILAWVGAGGSLLLSPGESPIPPDQPLLAQLPCEIGPVSSVDLPGAATQPGERGALLPHVIGRVLKPRAGAQPLGLTGATRLDAYRGGHGFGRIVVTPVDLAALGTDPSTWNVVFDALTDAAALAPRRKYDAPFYGYQSESEDQQREGAAMGAVCDWAAPQQPPRWAIPWVVLGILFVVGPVDSVVLYVLGRRHWTWSTLGGWIAFIACGVLFGMSHLGQTKVEYASVRAVDQVDAQTVATVDLVGVATSTGGRFRMDVGAGSSGWWQPAVPGDPAAAGPMQLDVPIHLSDAAATPEEQTLPAGGTRFLRSDKAAPGSPIIEATLAMGDGPRLSGTIKNLSALPLKDIRIRTRNGVVNVPLGQGGVLAPGQAVPIDQSAAGEPFDPEKVEHRYQNYGYFGSHREQGAVAEADLWVLATDLSGRRSLRCDEQIERGGDFACIYAQMAGPPAPAALYADGQITERHSQFVRALVSLRR